MLPVSVFIGSSNESRDAAEAIASVLGATVRCVCWWNAFPPSSLTIEALEAARRECPFAVFVGRAEDLLARRGTLDNVLRDNVVGEFFLFVGGNGHDHTYLFLDNHGTPKLPSDLAGLNWEPYDSDMFHSNPTSAILPGCERILRRISEVYACDMQARRELEERALSASNAAYLAELAEVAFLLREIIDAVQRDTLDALLDEQKFAAIKSAALDRIEQLSLPSEGKARSAGVLDDFIALKRAILNTVAALPFPREAFSGLEDAQTAYEGSVLGALPALAEAVLAKDLVKAMNLAVGLRDKLSYEALVKEVAQIADERLGLLKRSYASWWQANSRATQNSLNTFQRALMRAQTRIVLRIAQVGTPVSA